MGGAVACRSLIQREACACPAAQALQLNGLQMMGRDLRLERPQGYIASGIAPTMLAAPAAAISGLGGLGAGAIAAGAAQVPTSCLRLANAVTQAEIEVPTPSPALLLSRLGA